MSLPLTRRIAQAALLVAAGATPLLVAGSASAAELVPQHTDLASGVSKLDGVTSDSNLKTETHQVGQALGKTGALAVGTIVPAAADTTGTAATTALPQSDKSLGDLTPQNSTSNATGVANLLASPATAFAQAAPTLAGLLAPAAVHRGMPTGAMSNLPGLPTVSGVDKVVNADTVSNPLAATTHLTDSVPATSQLSGTLPAATDRIGGALPTGDTLGGLPVVGGLSHGLPGTGSLRLEELAGHPTDATHRLSSLPDLGDTNPVAPLLGSLTGALQHPPTVS
ncbi:hypothetical protein P3T37_004481 [Kitasatospora sp. MAA4]|uniref:hypothetical protein n=1 Tax=Kitasatospora sp. MAA4 TaxID=3035093 RepID=UPI00247430C7|nr:hypothetical protein [Kitasatospora sp. MAA4]MDH6135071.1 hypothetical protein [Kitasatospora sp. MAA4]